MSLMSDRAVKQKGRPVEPSTQASGAAAVPLVDNVGKIEVAPLSKEDQRHPVSSASTKEPDPLADVAVSEVAFKRSPMEALDVVVEQPKPDKVTVQKFARAPRVRVTQKAKFMLRGTLYRFEVGQVLDSNHYDDGRFRELLTAIHTEPVEE